MALFNSTSPFPSYPLALPFTKPTLRFVSTAHGLAVGIGAVRIIYGRKLFDKDVFRPYSVACDNMFATTLVRTLLQRHRVQHAS